MLTFGGCIKRPAHAGYLCQCEMEQQTNNMHLFTCFILSLSLVRQTSATPVKITVRLEEQRDPPSRATEQEKEEDCTACAQLKEALTKTPSSEEIRQARVEHVKQTILHKLRMRGRPNITQPLKRLPEPLLKKYGGLYAHEGPLKSDRTEEYYAETHEVISFAESVRYCDRSNSSVCFTFHLKHSVNSDEIKSAKLYTKNISPGDEMIIYDTSYHQSNPDFIASKTSTSKSWIHFNVHDTILNSVENSLSAQISLKLTCGGCGRNFLSNLQENLPFLELHTDQGPERNRRRIGECTGDNRCCKEDFYVSFAEIGWNDWIHSPEGYWANYCTGSCTDLHELPAYQHSRVMFGLSSVGRTAKARLSPCCSPTKLSKLSLLYQDEDGEVLKQDLPNMAVDSCGCA